MGATSAQLLPLLALHFPALLCCQPCLILRIHKASFLYSEASWPQAQPLKVQE